MHNHSFKNTIFSFRTIATVLLIYCLLIAPFITLLENEKQHEIQRFDDQIRVEYVTQIKLFSNKLNKRFESLASTSQLLAGSRILYNFINNPFTTKQTLVDTWGRLMLGNGELRQIRFIDLKGYEKVRVDYTPKDGVQLAKKLRYKGGSDYFRYASLMAMPWAFYGADLESEDGEYVKPYTMAMRILVPVLDESGNRLGYLVVNLAINRIFENLLGELVLDDRPIILGGDSQYLYGVEDSRLYGARIATRKEHSLVKDNPAFWEKVKLKREGVYRQDNVYTVFDRIDLPLSGLGTAKLTVIHDYNDEQVAILALHNISEINEKMFVGMILLFFIAFPLALFVIFYRELVRHIHLSYAAMKSMSPVMLTNEQGNIEQVNESYCRIFEVIASEIIGKPSSILHPDVVNNDIYTLIRDSLEVSGEWRGEVSRLSKVGDEHIDFVEAVSFGNSKKTPTNLVITFYDITEEKRLKRELELLTVTDAMTGCKNRRFYETAIAHEIESFRRYPEQIFCLVLVDIDHFKRVNDEFGHDVGDQVLKSFVLLLEANVRTIDMVCRVGGEEFAIILPNTTCDNALILLERMRHSVEVSDINPKITCSIGYCQCTKSDTPETLYAKTDVALYQAKNNGRNQVVQSATVSKSGTGQ